MRTDIVAPVLTLLVWIVNYRDKDSEPDIISTLLEYVGAVCGIVYTIKDTLTHPTNYIAMVCHLSVAFICLAMLFNDWRKKRKKKPSKVLSRIKNIGHRLVLVPVPVKS